MTTEASAAAKRTASVLDPENPESTRLSLWTPAKADPAHEHLLWGRRSGSPVDLPFLFLRGCLEPALVTYLLKDSCIRSVVRASVEELCPEAYRGHKAESFHAADVNPWQQQVMMVGFEHDGWHAAVSRRLFAFVRAWRQANFEAIAAVAAAVNMDGERLFGSITVQHLINPTVQQDDPNEVLGWHVDSWASAVHLSLSLKGHRTLFFRSCFGAGPPSETELMMAPGDVYLSSPAFFAHKVRKQELDAVAVQIRIAVPTSEAEPGVEAWPVMAQRLALALQQHHWHLPTLAQVSAAQQELRSKSTVTSRSSIDRNDLRHKDEQETGRKRRLQSSFHCSN